MTEQLPIAVVIPCYNHANLLRRTLEGLSFQTKSPVEVVVVDDGSAENPEQIVKDFGTRLPVKFVRFDENHGAPYTRNHGASLTQAPYLLFLDADTELFADALESMYQALQTSSDVSFAYSDMFWGLKYFKGRKFDVDELKKRNYIDTTSLIRRPAFPGFDESLKKFQDWDLWLTMAKNGHKGVWIDRALYRKEERKEGMSKWFPSFMHRIPWEKLGFMPKEIKRYREAEAIIRRKHGI